MSFERHSSLTDFIQRSANEFKVKRAVVTPLRRENLFLTSFLAL